MFIHCFVPPFQVPRGAPSPDREGPCLFIFSFQVKSQSLTWSGGGGDDNFFNELNWYDITTDQSPEIGSIDPFEAINFDLNLNCNAVASTFAGQGVNISSQTPEIFNSGPNEIWPFVFFASYFPEIVVRKTELDLKVLETLNRV